MAPQLKKTIFEKKNYIFKIDIHRYSNIAGYVCKYMILQGYVTMDPNIETDILHTYLKLAHLTL